MLASLNALWMTLTLSVFILLHFNFTLIYVIRKARPYGQPASTSTTTTTFAFLCGVGVDTKAVPHCGVLHEALQQSLHLITCWVSEANPSTYFTFYLTLDFNLNLNIWLTRLLASILTLWMTRLLESTLALQLNFILIYVVRKARPYGQPASTSTTITTFAFLCGVGVDTRARHINAASCTRLYTSSLHLNCWVSEANPSTSFN